MGKWGYLTTNPPPFPSLLRGRGWGSKLTECQFTLTVGYAVAILDGGGGKAEYFCHAIVVSIRTV